MERLLDLTYKRSHLVSLQFVRPATGKENGNLKCKPDIG